jgi:fatty acid elongase 3
MRLPNFDFKKLPFSSITSVVIVLLGYYTCITAFGLWGKRRRTRAKTTAANPLFLAPSDEQLRFPRPRRRSMIHLKRFFIGHNFILSAISLVLFLALLANLMLQQTSLFQLMCLPASNIAHYLPYIYYTNYLLKHYELIDTLVLLLTHRNLPNFLHIYHHSATLILCYTQLAGDTCAQWIPIGLNLFVHAIMYFYYAETAKRGRRLWWRRYLTTLQIGQFCVDVIAVIAVLYWKHTASCCGSLMSIWFALIILVSYLVLFIRFYRKHYVQTTNNR